MIESTIKSFNYSGLAANFEFKENIVKLNSIIKKKDCHSILKEKELFWLAFCKSISIQNLPEDYLFNVKSEEEFILYSGKEHIIEQIKNIVEELRSLLIKSQEQRQNLEIVRIPTFTNSFVFREKSDFHDVKKEVYRDVYKKHWFVDLVLPGLPQLTNLCGASFEEKKVEQTFKTFSTKVKNVSCLIFKWNEEENLVYPISPKEIPAPLEIGKGLYN